MISHVEYGKELNSFSYNMKDISPSSFKIQDETHKRVLVSKLYYALFHRIMEELPFLQGLSGPGQHKTIKETLQKQANKSTTNRNLLYLFNDLKSLREWADYEVFTSPPPTNMNSLYQKTFTTINSPKLIFI